MKNNLNYKIVFEDNDIIVVHKGAGLALASSHIGQMDLVSALTKYLSSTTGSTYLGVIHRLDQPVSGLVVFAKNPEAAASLSKQAAGTDMEKEYEAIIYGHMSEKTGVLEDYLAKDMKTNMAIRSDKNNKKAKFAKLSYEVIKSDEKLDYVKIKLFTGRHHQIRAQFSFRNCPLVGDVKYGNETSNLYSKENDAKFVKLLAARLSFIHPTTKERVSFAVDEGLF